MWNPIDLGYAAIQLAAAAAKGQMLGAGSAVTAGRVGMITFDAQA